MPHLTFYVADGSDKPQCKKATKLHYCMCLNRNITPLVKAINKQALSLSSWAMAED